MSTRSVSGGAGSGLFARIFQKLPIAWAKPLSVAVIQPLRTRALPGPHVIAPAIILLLIAATSLSGCSSGGKVSGTGLSPRVIPLGQPVPKGGGRWKVGSPYKIDGRWYRPREDTRYDRTGTASWYGEMFHGRYTANGEIYDMDALTAAHPTLPMPVYAKVTNMRNGRSLVVRINDRGPYKHDRVIDLSRRSARLLGFERNGTAPVRVQYLGRAPLNGDDRYERHYLAQQRWRSRGFASAKSDSLTVGALPRARPTSARAAPPLRQDIFIQAGTFRDPANAHRFKQRLARHGHAHVDASSGPSGVLYRVSLGPYADDDIAERTLTNVVRSGITDAVIIRK